MPSALKLPSKTKKNFLFLCQQIAIILILTVTITNLQHYFSNSQTVYVLGTKTDNSQILTERNYWANLVAQHPTYIDGWLELAQLEQILGNEDLTISALNTAISINPNYPKLPQF